ncbi:phosphorylase family protein [Legionella fallonii]|uniref:Putative Hopanoid-associated phosphorylase n=1 Tax=Legionella fallonii LLAP-10 TaxID=1212491 RepID=A0A098GBW9_9GAMM|nr:hypothetical protein [Legionella fallonii]CEG58981.1 Putative Hopanoid-associated phosphorylase [Legionella fallonii LLAP-10]
MFGILIAMPTEARCFSSSFCSIGEVYTFTPKALVAVSGMGELASQAAQTLIKKGVTCLISCGTAVGLAPSIKPGTLCVPQKILNHSKEVYYCDNDWRQQLLTGSSNKISLDEGNLIHTPNILTTSNEKQTLHDSSGAIAADMESLFIAQEAKRHQIPFVALRVVIDDAHFTMPKQLTEAVSSNGEVAIRKILLSLGKQPKLIYPLTTLAINFNKTRKVLKTISQMKMFVS